VKHVRTEGGKPAGPGQPEQGGNFRDRERERSPLRRPREFDMPDMRGGSGGGREPDLMMRPGGGPQHRDLDNRGPRDFDGRDWNARDQRHDQHMDPYPPADPYMMERERDTMHQRDQQFYPPVNDHRGQFG